MRNPPVPCCGEMPDGPHQRDQKTTTDSSQRLQCALKESSPAQLFSQTSKAPHYEINNSTRVIRRGTVSGRTPCHRHTTTGSSTFSCVFDIAEYEDQHFLSM